MAKNIIIERLRAECPEFFKKLRAAAISIGVSAIAVKTINSAMALNLDPGLIGALGYVIAACVAIAGTAQLTKK